MSLEDEINRDVKEIETEVPLTFYHLGTDPTSEGTPYPCIADKFSQAILLEPAGNRCEIDLRLRTRGELFETLPASGEYVRFEDTVYKVSLIEARQLGILWINCVDTSD
jgi:hypothetical protein